MLLIQGVMIWWLGGSNGFEVPFVNIAAANMQYLKIGLWETTAYALVCAVTLNKSLHISDTFPAKKWSQTRKFQDIKLNHTEIIIIVLGSIALLCAAIAETFFLVG